MGLSFLIHALVFTVSYVLIMKAVEQKNEEATIELFMGKVGEGQGSVRPTLKSGSNEITDENIANAQQKKNRSEGVEDGFEDGVGVDWGKAMDPSLDSKVRYNANIVVEVSPDDYPAAARKSNLGPVTVAVTLYITAAGKIRGVIVRYVRSAGNAHKPFEEEFIRSARRVFLRKSTLINMPYQQEGSFLDFKWDTVVTFNLR